MSLSPQLKRQKMSQGKKFGDGDIFNYQELNIIGTGERIWDFVVGIGRRYKVVSVYLWLLNGNVRIINDLL